MKNKKNVQKISKNELIQAVSKTSNVNMPMVEIVIDALENTINEALKNVNANKDISIKLFDGLYIDGLYIPEKQQKNNLTGKLINIASKIKIKARITRGYGERINQ